MIATRRGTMTADVEILRYGEVAAGADLAAGLDAVFFQASNTQEFTNGDARAAFRERWLGRYLEHDARFAFVALAAGGRVAGYVVGSVDDPALTPRFADTAYFQAFKDLTARFPAHLHVNLGPEFRGQGIGGAMIARFVNAARAAGSPGLHVVTSRAARNVAFYARNGFHQAGANGEGVGEIVFLARKL